ncbi:glutamine synthetase [Angomonas deanei]|uniref:glutamine synthetase n=2 Tax=Angomonas deanei TaxID=59799 RepID=A0A7G2CME0_9TRYP|nr:glutamine synthetase [Angomonas deanei]CAD2220094.1 Glutamine synthetase, beta-Grasp domain/Glutamine synthetase, catalytic domain containing protein, putative [Angomonas deanei]|eukprot:EPY39827.1 glutamine synthetase [Angomonas deanei]
MSTDKKATRVTYIWLGGKDSHHDIRSKDRTMYLTEEELKQHPKELLLKDFFPVWNFDGSSTGQALGTDTEILLKPVNAYPCCLPRRAGSKIPWILVLAECYLPTGEPTPDNSRASARQTFDLKTDERPWFGLEQEFFIVDRNGRPFGWPAHGFPLPQGPYYCGTGAPYSWGRQYVDLHYETCLEMGLSVSGTNEEVTPAQWEFQVGPCEGIEMGDQIVVARWVLLRILEDNNLDVDYRAKPIKGDWNGSGLHTNFSTESTRAENGLDAIHQYIERLSKTVKKDIVFYGAENDVRLTGKHETSSISQFSFGVGTRTTSIRIPNSVASERRGYMEDRRPAGDADPYLITSRLFASCLGLEAPALDVASPTHEKDWMKRAFA